MTETVVTETVRNGVNTATMFATLDAIKAQPEIAQFRFRAYGTSSSIASMLPKGWSSRSGCAACTPTMIADELGQLAALGALTLR